MDLTHVVDTFDRAAADRPLGLAVLRGEEVVLERAAGTRADGRPFRGDTPVLLYSVAKAAVGMTATLLAATGRVDLDAPVAHYWPAFGAHDKGGIAVAQALSHGAAVPAWPTPRTLDDLLDMDRACDALADQPPWWPPGEPGEHVYTYGHLISGITRGATGRHVHELWADELAGPFGIELALTPPRDVEPLRDPGGAFAARMAERRGTGDPRMWEPAALTDHAVVNGLADGGPATSARPPGVAIGAKRVPARVWPRSRARPPAESNPGEGVPVVPAVLGWAGAAAVARMFAVWSGTVGPLPGDPAVWRRSTTAHTTGTDHVMGVEAEWAFGTGIEGATWGMGGIGGCVGWHNQANGLSIGITTPVLAGAHGISDELEQAIDALV